MADDADAAALRQEAFLEDGIAAFRAQGDVDRRALSAFNGKIPERACSSCGEDIPAARLMARPSAVLCVDCQENMERRH